MLFKNESTANLELRDPQPSTMSESENTIMYDTLNETLPWDVTHYLGEYLGPKHLPLASLLPMSVVYSIIFFTGIIGNFSTCFVVARAQYMRTSICWYYLFNLAVADMLTLIFGKVAFSTFHMLAILFAYLYHLACI